MLLGAFFLGSEFRDARTGVLTVIDFDHAKLYRLPDKLRADGTNCV